MLYFVACPVYEIKKNTSLRNIPVYEIEKNTSPRSIPVYEIEKNLLFVASRYTKSRKMLLFVAASPQVTATRTPRTNYLPPDKEITAFEK